LGVDFSNLTMNSAGKIIGIDFTAPKPQSMSESHLTRRQANPLCGCCGLCQETTYDFVSPDGARHHAVRDRSGCLDRLLCREVHDTTDFRSARGPDFENKMTVACWRYCLCPCLDLLEPICTCAQTCGKKHTISTSPDKVELGQVLAPTCWETCMHCIFPGKNKILLKTALTDGTEKYYIRSDSTFVYKKLPITAPNEQTPIGWITLNAQKSWPCCGGIFCVYCLHKKTALLEVDHAHGLPFNERAHLMAAAIKLDDALLLPYVGCCCNDP